MVVANARNAPNNNANKKKNNSWPIVVLQFFYEDG